MPRLLLHVGHLFTVEELRKAADLVVHHAASVLAGAAQRAQEQLTLFGVTSQLRQRTEMTHIQQCEGGGHKQARWCLLLRFPAEITAQTEQYEWLKCVPCRVIHCSWGRPLKLHPLHQSESQGCFKVSKQTDQIRHTFAVHKPGVVGVLCNASCSP